MKTNVTFKISTCETTYTKNFVKIRQLILFDQNGDLGSKFSKTNVRFEVSTFEIEHMRNFANKIRKVILFDPKYPNLGIWSQNF